MIILALPSDGIYSDCAWLLWKLSLGGVKHLSQLVNGERGATAQGTSFTRTRPWVPQERELIFAPHPSGLVWVLASSTMPNHVTAPVAGVGYLEHSLNGV